MRITLLAILIFLTSSCKKLIMFEDDKLSLPKLPYTGQQLRVDGYYYNNYANNTYRAVVFFYDNGIVLDAGAYQIDEMSSWEKKILTSEWLSVIKKSKMGWGVFKVENNIIQYEMWYPSNPPLKAYVREGEVLNDTTFVITESYRLVKGQKTDAIQRNEVYHFKEFNPKPDSTNNFIP